MYAPNDYLKDINQNKDRYDVEENHKIHNWLYICLDSLPLWVVKFAAVGIPIKNDYTLFLNGRHELLLLDRFKGTMGVDLFTFSNI